MGGHGGLNILPQKRWNVYNYQNRIKVEKDKQKAKEKEKQLEKEKFDSQASLRYEILKIKNKKIRKDNNYKSELNKEFNQILLQKEKKNLNLFQNEEKIMEQKEELQAKIEKNTNHYKDLPYDESSKFMGSLNSKNSQPWYLMNQSTSHSQQKQGIFLKIQEQKKEYEKQQIQNQINNFEALKNNYFIQLEMKMKTNIQENQKIRFKEIIKQLKKEQDASKIFQLINKLKYKHLKKLRKMPEFETIKDEITQLIKNIKNNK